MKTILLCLAASLIGAAAETGTAREIVALERRAIEGWLTGDAGPQLANTDAAITYYHAPLTNGRLEGIGALRDLYEPYRGRPLFDSYEMTDAKVQEFGDTAVLTYQLVTHNGTRVGRWNATQVYHKTRDGWRVVHTHWSRNGADGA